MLLLRRIVHQCETARCKYKASVSVGLKGNLSCGACDCKGGKSGYCKYVAAVACRLWDLQKQGCHEIPKDKAVIEAPAYWKVRNSSESGPLLVSDITVVKHGPLTSKRGLTDDEVASPLNPRRKRAAERYEPFVQKIAFKLYSFYFYGNI